MVEAHAFRGRFSFYGLSKPVRVCLFAFFAFRLSPFAFATAPALSQILPPGAQRGTEVEARFLGARIGDAQEIFFNRKGIEVLKLIPVNDGEFKAKLKIAPDCALGLRSAYVRTWSGISNLVLFSIGQFKEIDEPEPNGEREKAPKVELNTTINGIVGGEDVDYFAFEAQPNQRVNFEIEGLRLGSSPLDPTLTLFDSTGKELQAADDSPLLGEDCSLGYTFKDAGAYTIQVREASYGGGGNYYYRLHMGTFPRPLGIYPSGGKPGQTINARWLGEPMLGDQQTTVTLPQESGTTGLFPIANGHLPPSEVPVRISNLENIMEIEPNNSVDKATTITLPCAANGIISEDKDIDWFQFNAKKGQVFDFQLYGRRLGSPLDSVVILTNNGGGGIIGDDDAAKVDSYFRWTVPDDGHYRLYVKDHLDRGGPTYFYRLEITPVEPGVTLVDYMPGIQNLQNAAVPVGNRMASMLSVRRKDLGGAMKILAENLPAGLKAESEDAADGIGDVPILFTADEKTTACGKLADIAVKPADDKVKVMGHIDQPVELVRIMNNNPIVIHDQKELALAVTERVPFRIDVIEPKVPIVRNGVMSLLVKATREKDYKEPIDLRLLWNPPGIGSGGARIEGGATTTTLALNAAGNAQIRDWKVAVIGRANVGNGPMEVSTQLAKLTVAEPWIEMAFEKMRTDQGTSATLVAKLTPKHEFQGSANVEILGLPTKVTTNVQKATKETAELKYLIGIPPDAPVGKFDGIFARATIMDQGEPIVHQIGGAELRIDKPLPPKADEPKKDAGPKVTAKPPEGPQRGARKMAVGIAPFQLDN